MKLAVTYPDAERLTIDLLAGLLEELEPDVTIGIGVPEGWTNTSPVHLQVARDFSPLKTPPIIEHATIRIIAHADTTSEAKRLAGLAEGLLLAHTGGNGISVVRPIAGVLPAQDPDTHAELASITVRVSVRSTPIDADS